jgi:uncharacterized protein YjbJ (UPF0337 family)
MKATGSSRDPTKGDKPMKRSTKDTAKGKLHKVKGRVKQMVGRATKNRRLEVEGLVEKTGGRIQEKIGRAEKVLGK